MLHQLFSNQRVKNKKKCNDAFPIKNTESGNKLFLKCCQSSKCNERLFTLIRDKQQQKRIKQLG